MKVTLRNRILNILLLLTFSLSAQPREFPNTRDGVYVFYDQIPHTLSDDQVRFVAENYVGCQKIPLDLVRTIRQYNDQFIVLNYRLAFGTYEDNGQYLVGNEWINDWDSTGAHPDWFITDAGSPDPDGRIQQTDWEWYLMDISGEINGNVTNGWKEYWTRSVLNQLWSTECDGIFADSYGLPWNLNRTPAWLQPPDDTAWIRHMEIFGHYVQDHFKFQPEQFYFLPNLGPWVTTRDTCDYGAFTDGVMIEFFGSWGAWDLFDIEDWKLQMNRILDLERREKIILCQPITEDEWAVGERMYNLANYLLIKGEKTYYNLVFDENFYDRLIYLPEYQIDLGDYLDEVPEDIDAFYNAGLGLYKRQYENGMVLLNPTWNNVLIQLDKPYLAIDRNNLIDDPLVDIEEDGVFRDDLSYVTVSDTLTVGNKGGVILLEFVDTGVLHNKANLGHDEFTLIRNYPNPFNISTRIYLPYSEGLESSDITLKIFNVGGRLIRTLKPISNQNHVIWNGTDRSGSVVPSGVYFGVVQIDRPHYSVQFNCTKMILLK